MRAIESWDEAYMTESDAYQLRQDAGMPGISAAAKQYRLNESAKLYALVDAWNKAHEPELEEAEQIAGWLHGPEAYKAWEFDDMLGYLATCIRRGDYK